MRPESDPRAGDGRGKLPSTLAEWPVSAPVSALVTVVVHTFGSAGIAIGFGVAIWTRSIR